MTTTTDITIDVDEKAFFTIEALVDELFLCLAKTQEVVTNKENDDKRVTVRKYYRQARDLMMLIPIAKPIPPFMIYISDLTLNVKAELDELALSSSPDDVSYILRQAAGRIFENLDFNYYHLSIARSLKVRLQ
jgi:hypothetical protein